MNASFEKIDPNLVPKRKLYTGTKIPAVGLGTFGSNRFTANQIAETVVLLWETAKDWQDLWDLDGQIAS